MTKPIRLCRWLLCDVLGLHALALRSNPARIVCDRCGHVEVAPRPTVDSIREAWADAPVNRKAPPEPPPPTALDLTPTHRRILDYIRDASAHGATCDEVEAGLRLLHQTASARINELVEAELIYIGTARRLTRAGRSARVHLVTGQEPEPDPQGSLFPQPERDP